MTDVDAVTAIVSAWQNHDLVRFQILMDVADASTRERAGEVLVAATEASADWELARVLQLAYLVKVRPGMTISAAIHDLSDDELENLQKLQRGELREIP